MDWNLFWICGGRAHRDFPLLFSCCFKQEKELIACPCSCVQGTWEKCWMAWMCSFQQSTKRLISLYWQNCPLSNERWDTNFSCGHTASSWIVDLINRVKMNLVCVRIDRCNGAKGYFDRVCVCHFQKCQPVYFPFHGDMKGRNKWRWDIKQSRNFTEL